MGDFYIKGKQVCGTSNNASVITCTDKDGTQSTVQAELDNLYNSTKEPIQLSFPSELNATLISANALYYKDGVYHVDAFVQTGAIVKGNTTFFSIIRNSEVISFSKRLDCFAESGTGSYYVVLVSNTGNFTANSADIPVGLYKLKMEIVEDN